MHRKEGVGMQGKRLFYFGVFSRCSPGRAGGGYIPLQWRPQPQRTRTACTSQAVAQAVPKCKADHATHRHTRPNAGHAGRSGRRRRWMAGNSSVMRIVIALSQAWSSDSNMHNYHINLLVYLVIVICYQVLDLPP